MSRRFTALKPQLNRIRAWAHEGSTDAWIAHQLDTTAEAVRAFRQEHGIERGGPAPLAPITPDSVVEAMLAEEEAAAAAAELGPEASAPEPEAPPGRGARACAPSQDAPARRQAGREGTRGRSSGERSRRGSACPQHQQPAPRQPAAEPGAVQRQRQPPPRSSTSSPPPRCRQEPEAAGDDEPARTGTARKRGGRRRGRGRGAGRGLEARLLPGSVLLLDPAVTADPLFQEHWAEGRCAARRDQRRRDRPAAQRRRRRALADLGSSRTG